MFDRSQAFAQAGVPRAISGIPELARREYLGQVPDTLAGTN